MTPGHSPPRLAHDRAGLDAESLGGVAGGNGDSAVGRRLHDNDRLAAQGRGLLLLARCKEGIKIEEEPLDGRLGIVHLLFYTAIRQNFASTAFPSAGERARRGGDIVYAVPRSPRRQVRAKIAVGASSDLRGTEYY
jgi:hypothetical protein